MKLRVVKLSISLVNTLVPSFIGFIKVLTNLFSNSPRFSRHYWTVTIINSPTSSESTQRPSDLDQKHHQTYTRASSFALNRLCWTQHISNKLFNPFLVLRRIKIQSVLKGSLRPKNLFPWFSHCSQYFHLLMGLRILEFSNFNKNYVASLIKKIIPISWLIGV